MGDTSEDTAPSRQPSARASWRYRLVAGLVGAGCLAVLGVAMGIEPDASGVGTHRQLGMKACGWYERTGYPCLTCGITTAFSHMVRGQVWASFRTQPAGALAALACVTLTVLMGYAAFAGQRLDGIWQQVNWRMFIVTAAGIVLAAWLGRCGVIYFGNQ